MKIAVCILVVHHFAHDSSRFQRYIFHTLQCQNKGLSLFYCLDYQYNRCFPRSPVSDSLRGWIHSRLQPGSLMSAHRHTVIVKICRNISSWNSKCIIAPSPPHTTPFSISPVSDLDVRSATVFTPVQYPVQPFCSTKYSEKLHRQRWIVIIFFLVSIISDAHSPQFPSWGRITPAQWRVMTSLVRVVSWRIVLFLLKYCFTR
jgi:hypothetical protein